MYIYYRIIDKDLVGRRDDFLDYYIYYPGRGWEKDTSMIIRDRLMGYDESEEKGSPYRIGNSDIMEMVEVITEEEANKIIKNM